MKNVKLLRSLKDLAAFRAKDLCSEEKPYYKQFIDVYEKKLMDDLIQEAIENENQSRVLPVIQRFAETNTDIPVPFEVDGRPVNQIRLTGDSYYKRCEAPFNGDKWHCMDGSDKLRLFEALDKVGCLDNLE